MIRYLRCRFPTWFVTWFLVVVVLPRSPQRHSHYLAEAFLPSVATTSATASAASQRLLHKQPRVSRLQQSLDYEYVPTGEASSSSSSSNQNNNLLLSVYPPGTPAGLRGEAVRSALRSGQCVGWSNDSVGLQQHDKDDAKEANDKPSFWFGGGVTLEGPGCLAFLNNQLSQSFPVEPSAIPFKKAALLTSKGRLVDHLGVAILDPERALLLTSPNHAPSTLYQRLDKYIFPLDQVALREHQEQFQFTLASCHLKDVQRVWNQDILPNLQVDSTHDALPASDQCAEVMFSNKKDSLVVIPDIGLPSCAAQGYTFVWLGGEAVQIGRSLWSNLISDQNSQGPVAMGPSEYESLRIQAGQIQYGSELKGHEEKTAKITPASPLELFVPVDLDKGCYMGQEGVASLAKNPRGPPRTLYQVVWEDEFNVYDYQTTEDVQASYLENQTHVPQSGDTLCVLGSNEEIVVGTVTSVAEPGSTGEPHTLGLALVKRASGIVSAMKQRELEFSPAKNLMAEDGLILPPPMDPLDGLEVIVKGSFAVGTLRSIPSRRLLAQVNMFVNEIPGFLDDLEQDNEADSVIDVTRVPLSTGDSVGGPTESNAVLETDTNNELEDDDEEEKEAEMAKALEKAAREAEEAAAEAQRKAEKMELLKQRAEALLARRKQKPKD